MDGLGDKHWFTEEQEGFQEQFSEVVDSRVKAQHGRPGAATSMAGHL